jgi:hypothetical protein
MAANQAKITVDQVVVLRLVGNKMPYAGCHKVREAVRRRNAILEALRRKQLVRFENNFWLITDSGKKAAAKRFHDR